MDLHANDLKHLFVSWIEEAAIKASQNNSRAALGLSQALDKLKAHKEPIKGPKDISKIQYFGEKRVKFLSKKLKEYCFAEGYRIPKAFRELEKNEEKNKDNSATSEVNASFHSSQDSPIKTNTSNSKTSKKRATTRPYVPAKRSGGYAVLIVLAKYDQDKVGMTKDEIISKASQYSDKSFHNNHSTGQFYSAWSSVKTLINKGLIKGSGRPMHYYLTYEGTDLAESLLKAEEGEDDDSNINNIPKKRNRSDEFVADRPSINKGLQALYENEKIDLDKRRRISQGKSETGRSKTGLPQNITNEPSPLRKSTDFLSNNSINDNGKNPKYTDKISSWKPKSFDVVLIIDNRESKSHSERNFFPTKLQSLGINVKVEPLAVGDCLWIAKHKETKEEVVLDFILERKRLDDLVSSIMDGRFYEQKARLNRSGFTNIYYLVEETFGSDITKFAEAIKTSMSLAIVGNGFYLRRSKDSDDTVLFLKNLTNRITEFYQSKELTIIKSKSLNSQIDFKITLEKYKKNYQNPCLTFEAFQATLNKSGLVTVKEMYVRMLMAIKGVSLDKALIIQKYYSTPKKLIEAYKNLGDDISAKKLMIRNKTIKEIGIKSVGPKISEKVYESWGKFSYN